MRTKHGCRPWTIQHLVLLHERYDHLREGLVEDICMVADNGRGKPSPPSKVNRSTAQELASSQSTVRRFETGTAPDCWCMPPKLAALCG